MERSKKFFSLPSMFIAMMMLGMFATTFMSCGGDSTDTLKADARGKIEAAPVTPAAANPTDPAAAAANATPAVPAGPTTTVEFGETEFDFGVVEDGEKVTHLYKFENTGTEPLIISNARGSCGCTVPQWPKEPIAPGEKSEIKVEFNSAKKVGKQTKTVTIEANIPGGKTTLKIKGEVKAKPGDKGAAPAGGVQVQPAAAAAAAKQ